MIPIIIGFECSGIVRNAFREKGFDAWSCDIKPATDGSPYHIQGNITTIDLSKFKNGIFFPPCTHIAASGSAHFEKKRKDGRQQEGIDTFMWCTRFPGNFCIENPVGIMSNLYRKPDQTINPYYFGDSAQKRTCLWLNGFPKLLHYKQPSLFGDPVHVDRGEMVQKFSKTKNRVITFPKWNYDAKKGDNNHGEIRSVFFPGIARAMASQWAPFITE